MSAEQKWLGETFIPLHMIGPANYLLRQEPQDESHGYNNTDLSNETCILSLHRASPLRLCGG
jgi:hypothetical protein